VKEYQELRYDGKNPIDMYIRKEEDVIIICMCYEIVNRCMDTCSHKSIRLILRKIKVDEYKGYIKYRYMVPYG